MSKQMLELADRLAGSLQPFNFLTRDERDLIIAALRSSAESVTNVRDGIAAIISDRTMISDEGFVHNPDRVAGLILEAFPTLGTEPQKSAVSAQPLTAILCSCPGCGQPHQWREPFSATPQPARNEPQTASVREAILMQALETAAGRFNMMAGVGLVNGADPKVGYRECMDALKSVRSQAGIEQRHMAQLLTILDVMKSAHRKEPDRLMSIWPRDIEAVEAAVAALTRPQCPTPSSPDVSAPAQGPRE